LQFHHEVADEKRGFRSLDIAIQWTRHPNESLCAFVNSWPVERGPHIRGFHRGVTHAIRRFGAAREIGADRALGLDEVCAGLTGIIALRIPEPQFLGSTRTHLGNQDVQGFVQRPVRLQLLNYLQTHPNEANVILEWIASRRPGASGCVQ
jgi:DNA gyrase subunit B